MEHIRRIAYRLLAGLPLPGPADTAGQNIANANTAGYTRQRVNISS